MKRFVWQLVVACTAASALAAQEPSTPVAKKLQTQEKTKVDKQSKKPQPPASDQQPKKEEKGSKDRKKPKKDNRIRLIVRGDDFGATHASNLALEEAFSDGTMKSAGVMVPGPWFLETAAIAREHPEWCIGVHLTINSEWGILRWRPILPMHEVPSLVAEDGFMYWNHWKTAKFVFGNLSPKLRAEYAPLTTYEQPDPVDVEKELRAQIELAKANGIRIEYLDCHMRTACTGELLPIMKQLAEELCVPVPEEGLLGEHRIQVSWDRKTVKSAKEGIKKLLPSLTPGLWKTVIYPTYDTPELRAVDVHYGPRIAEEHTALYEAWKDPEIRQVIAENDIQLVSIREVWDYEKCEPK